MESSILEIIDVTSVRFQSLPSVEQLLFQHPVEIKLLDLETNGDGVLRHCCLVPESGHYIQRLERSHREVFVHHWHAHCLESEVEVPVDVPLQVCSLESRAVRTLGEKVLAIQLRSLLAHE